MKQAFVTGASGFLGSNLVRALLEEGWQVTVFVLPNDPLTYLDTDQITCHRGNILDKESLRRAMPEGQSVTVFHVAGMTSMWHKQNIKQYQINVIGTKCVCEVAIEKGVKRLVYTSSISAYGYHYNRVHESTVSNALTCKMNYNISKYLGEEEVRKAILQGLDAVMVNPCNIVGPYDKVGWATLIVSAKNGKINGATDGLATFSHVKDVARAHIRAGEVGVCGENYLLGGVEVTFREVMETICQMIGQAGPVKSMSPLILQVAMGVYGLQGLLTKRAPVLTYPRYKRLTGHIVCDDAKARKDLGYQRTSLKLMLQDSYDWLKGEGIV